MSHGVPTGYRLRDGYLVSIDCGAQLDGWTGDAATTFTVGTPHPGDLDLIDATQQALDAVIAAAQVGSRIGDISHALDTAARKGGLRHATGLGGHGIGRRMHEDPHVPNRGRPGRGFSHGHGERWRAPAGHTTPGARAAREPGHPLFAPAGVSA